MDYCGHLMKQCFETKKFIVPEPVSKIEHAKGTAIVFSDEDNKLNLRRCQKKQFYDQNICRHLCSTTLVLESTRTKPISPCESMCFELTKSSDSAGQVCPTQKYCRNGCPCPFYECEKFELRQKMIPVFDLKTNSSDFISDPMNTKAVTGRNVDLITARWHKRRKTERKFRKLIFSDFIGNTKNIHISDSFSSYERFC